MTTKSFELPTNEICKNQIIHSQISTVEPLFSLHPMFLFFFTRFLLPSLSHPATTNPISATTRPKHQNTNQHSLQDKSFPLGVCLYLLHTSPTLPLLVLTVFHHSSLCLFLPNSPSPRFLLSLSCHYSPHHSLSPSFLLPTCLSSSFHLSILELTVPEGRGHLRTKWRISRQLCAHSLRWPSIIHSLLPPLFPLSIFSLPFSSPPTISAFTSLLLFHTQIACLQLALYPFLLFPHLIPAFSCSSYLPFLYSSWMPLTRLHSPLIIFSSPHAYCISPPAP